MGRGLGWGDLFEVQPLRLTREQAFTPDKTPRVPACSNHERLTSGQRKLQLSPPSKAPFHIALLLVENAGSMQSPHPYPPTHAAKPALFPPVPSQSERFATLLSARSVPIALSSTTDTRTGGNTSAARHKFGIGNHQMPRTVEAA